METYINQNNFLFLLRSVIMETFEATFEATDLWIVYKYPPKGRRGGGGGGGVNSSEYIRKREASRNISRAVHRP